MTNPFKKLRNNWTGFKENSVNNILSEDRFNYDVLNHTDLTRYSGKSGEINLETLNWGNYDLVVIDEIGNIDRLACRGHGAAPVFYGDRALPARDGRVFVSGFITIAFD